MARYTICIVGGAGGIGQPLALLCKKDPLVQKLSLFDVNPAVEGVAEDVSHIDSVAEVAAFWGGDIEKALEGADIVIIPAGFAQKIGMTRQDLFVKNADIVRDLSRSIAKVCPKAMICLITNPVNSCLPVMSEVMKKENAYDRNRLFGVVTLDVIRTCTFVAQELKVDPAAVTVDSIAGHSELTIVPHLSSAKCNSEPCAIPEEKYEELWNKCKSAGTSVLEKKRNTGTATLSMAYAAHRFANSLMRAMNGEEVSESAYVYAEGLIPDCPYFAVPVKLGKNGIMETPKMPTLTVKELAYLEESVLPLLKKDIQTGLTYAQAL